MLKLIGIIVLCAIVYLIVAFTTRTWPSYPLGPISETPQHAARQILQVLADKKYAELARYVSPDGLTFNLYPSLDLSSGNKPSRNVTLNIDEVAKIATDPTKHLFGYTDGKGDPIDLTTADFIKKYIYNHDYLNAPQVAVNKVLGSGNSQNTILEDATGRVVVAFHFLGFDPKYTGMDWTTLYLVFDNPGGEAYFLRGIAKDNWTI